MKVKKAADTGPNPVGGTIDNFKFFYSKLYRMGLIEKIKKYIEKIETAYGEINYKIGIDGTCEITPKTSKKNSIYK